MKRIYITLSLLAWLATVPLVGWQESIRFIDVTAEAGLRVPLDGMMAHAAAWGDVDGDGDIDLYVGGFADRPDVEYEPARGPLPNRLFRNLGNGRFEPTESSHVELHARSSDAVFADLNNDGMLDLVVANNTRGSSRLAPGLQRGAQLRISALFRNDRGTFVDASGANGSCPTLPGSTRSIGVLDYDLDGWLDLLVVDDRFGPEPRSRLCRNLGDFRFVDVTLDAGLPGDLFGLGLAIADINEDGRPDIFVSHSNRLFVSTKDGRYAEPSGPRTTLAWKPVDREDWPAGAVFADLNRDGRQDLVVGIHHERARNRVYLNDGLDGNVPVFRDVSAAAGLPAYLNTKSPHVEVQDFDNDGWPDLYFSAAWRDADARVTPLIFRHLGVRNGVPHFEPVRSLGADTPTVYFPVGPSGDFDGDGRVDVFLGNWFRRNHSRLLRNVTDAHRSLEVSVRGRTINRMGIGAKVYIYKTGALNREAGLLGFREIGIGYGFGSGQPANAHFGVGSETAVDVLVRFSDRSEKSLHGVETDTQLIVDQPQSRF